MEAKLRNLEILEKILKDLDSYLGAANYAVKRGNFELASKCLNKYNELAEQYKNNLKEQTDKERKRISEKLTEYNKRALEIRKRIPLSYFG